MKLSPPFTCSVLPLADGSPPRSPSGRRPGGLGIIQAVTLSACSAAFAAVMATTLCMVTLGHQSSLLEGIQMRLDRPQNDVIIHGNHEPAFRAHHKSTLQHSQSSSRGLEEASMKSPQYANVRYFGRRTIAPSNQLVGAPAYDNTSSTTPRGLVWLMSFPNSGTSYTIHAIREISNTTTATNYGLEGEIKDKESVPVFDGKNGENGPFFELIPGRNTQVPELILTKTHCSGFCTTCAPEGYVETPRSFLKGCLRSKRGFYSSKTNSMERKTVLYDPDLVKKAIHIIRNPMDNTVARFHLERKRYTAKKDTTWLEDHPNDKQGFQKWCKEMDASRALAKSHWVDDDLATALLRIPCHSEFYRYVQWHNLAFALEADLGIPTFVFHYEDYSTRFDDVTNDLIAFLELGRRGEAPTFIDNKKYDAYYSVDEKNSIALFVEEFATKHTRDHLHRYIGNHTVMTQTEAPQAIGV